MLVRLLTKKRCSPEGYYTQRSVQGQRYPVSPGQSLKPVRPLLFLTSSANRLKMVARWKLQISNWASFSYPIFFPPLLLLSISLHTRDGETRRDLMIAPRGDVVYYFPFVARERWYLIIRISAKWQIVFSPFLSTFFGRSNKSLPS